MTADGCTRRVAHGVAENDGGDGVGVEIENLEANIVERIAGQVIAGIVQFPGGAAVGRRFFRRLDSIGPREQAAEGNAGSEECRIVGSEVDRRPFGRQSPRGIKTGEARFNRLGSRGPNEPELRAVTVENESHEVRRPYHVEIQVQGDAVKLFL